MMFCRKDGKIKQSVDFFFGISYQVDIFQETAESQYFKLLYGSENSKEYVCILHQSIFMNMLPLIRGLCNNSLNE